MAIPRDFIDDVLARVDLVELIGQRVKLKKTGKNYSACCPFHSEKSPSFTVSPQKQFYHCFGCGAHGNAISFLMEFDRLEFPEAIDELAGQLGLEVPRSHAPNPKAQEKREDAYALMQAIGRQYYQNLKHHPAAVDYLKGRGLSGDIVKQFGIGYVPDSWDAVLKQFGTNSERQQLLLDTGMLVKNDQGRRYDRFRDRIMFPIRDRRGRVIAFGGRVLGDGTPKYLNSPETKIYHKGKELYGLFEVRQANREIPRILVVEGYMDVVALFQHGISYAVASLGTSTTAEQLQTLFRTTTEVVCCYDGDNAGREAAWRAMENALPLLSDGVSLKFVFLPDGEDPDSLVRSQGKAALEAQLDQAMPLSQFLLGELEKQVDMRSPDSRARLAQQALPLIDQVPESVFKVMLKDKLAKRLGVDQSQLDRFLSRPEPKAGPARGQAKAPQRQTPMRRAMALLLQNPALAAEVPPALPLRQTGLAGAEHLAGLLEILHQNPQLGTGQLLERYRGTPLFDAMSKLALWDLFEDQEQVDAKAELLDTLDRILGSFLEVRFQELENKGRAGVLTTEEKREYLELLMARKQA
ncbi:DNA primase [Gallaecimonas sp. GXIMD4217]|uniref:DNA primase n=1 Tax=Gallaecimonas sp. GXIMD4217 TaxID=3131927 RepID=UPI00311ADFD9